MTGRRHSETPIRRRRMRHDLPTTLIGEAIAHGPHVVADGRPFRTADDADGLHREDGEEQIPVGAVVPAFVHYGGRTRFSAMRYGVCVRDGVDVQ